MRILSKSVALVLGALLWALPVLAAIPCSPANCAMEHCAGCCAGMDEMPMQAPAVSLSQAPAQSPAPLCACAVSNEATASILVREAQRVATPSISTVDAALLLPSLAGTATQFHRTPPLLARGKQAQSILCTFQI
jgi:hypothetical protein